MRPPRPLFARAIGLLLASTLALAFVSATARAENADTFRAALAANDPLAAHRAARAWSDSDPTSVSARLALATTYAKAAAPAAAIEHIRVALRQNPDARTRLALRELAAASFVRLGEADAAWVERLALTPDPAALDPEAKAIFHDAFGAMLAPHAWAATLERVAREAEAGSPAATAHLAALTRLSGDLPSAQAVARRGRERFPQDQAVLNIWLTLLPEDLAEGQGEFTREAALALRSELDALAQAGADELLLARARRTLIEHPLLDPSAFGQIETLAINLPSLTAEIIRLEQAAKTMRERKRVVQSTTRQKLAAIQTALARQSDSPAPPAAWWETQLKALALAERQHWAAVAAFDEIAHDAARLQRATNLLGEADFDAGAALSIRAAALFTDPAAPTDADQSPFALRLADYDAEAVLALAARLRTGLAEARLRAALAISPSTPAARLNATDQALSSGVMSPEAWHARSLAAAELAQITEASFAAVRATQEHRARRTTPTPVEAAGLESILAATLRSAQDAATAAREAFARGELEPALEASAVALRHDPMRPDAWRVRLAAGLRLGDEALALEALRALWRADVQDDLDWRDALNLACRAGDWPLLLSLAETAREADPSLVDAWYFQSLAARALGHDHLLPEADEILKPSVWRMHSEWAQAMTRQAGKLDANFILGSALSELIGRADEPPGLRLWVAWMEGGRGAIGKSNPTLRARLLTGDAQDAHVTRLLGQTGASDYARSEAAKNSPGLAAWVEGVLALGRADTIAAKTNLTRAAADPAVPADLRALATRWAGEAAATWRPWRPTDVFHLTAAMVQAGASATEAAPGQLVLLSSPVNSGHFETNSSQRVRGATRDAAIVVFGFITIRPSEELSGIDVLNDPRLREWEDLSLRASPGATRPAIVSIAAGAQLSLRRVDALAGLEWNVGGVLETIEGSGSTGALNVLQNAKFLARDAHWSVSGLSVTGHAAWRGGHVDLYNHRAEVKKGGSLHFTDLSLAWIAWPAVAEGGSMRWDRVLGNGNLDTKDTAAGLSAVASSLVGAWPESLALPSGLTLIPFARESPAEVVEITTTEELETRLALARPGQILRLAKGDYAPKSTLTIPPGVTLNGSLATFVLPVFGTEPVIRVKGPGAVRLTRMNIRLDPPKGAYSANIPKRSLLAVSDGAVVVVQGGMLDWNTFDPRVPGLRLSGGAKLVVTQGTFLRGSASLSDASDLNLVAANPSGFIVTGAGRLLIGGQVNVGELDVRGPGLRVFGALSRATLSQGAGSERDLARQNLLRTARDTTWQQAARTFMRDYEAAADRARRVEAARVFAKAVIRANNGARAAPVEASEFAWSRLKPIFLARPDEVPYLDMATYPVFGHQFRSAADVGPTVQAARDAFYAASRLSGKREDTVEFDRALVMARSYPPGSVDYALVQSAYQRGLTPAQLAQELRDKAAREAELAATRERLRLAAIEENRRRHAALAAQYQQQRNTPAPAALRAYSSGYSSYGSNSYTPPPSPPQWTPSQSYRNDMYRRELEVTIRKNVYGR